MNGYDVIVVGGGPGGAAAAGMSAAAGLRTLVIERLHFPRDKVCGDCLNPGCWPIFDALGVAERVERLPGERLRWVDFVNLKRRRIRFDLPPGGRGERGIRRADLDALLLERAIELGAEVWFGEPVTEVLPSWEIRTACRAARGRYLIAADGRNSTVARLLGDYPRTQRDRVAFQTHVTHASPPHVALEFSEEGYVGLAAVGRGQTNVCLVCRPMLAQRFRRKLEARFGLSPTHSWSSVTPLSRKPVRTARPNLLYIGDAAQVVEPFTGEGIMYALKTGLLAADLIQKSQASGRNLAEMYWPAHAAFYRHRLWINQLARLAVLHPRVASASLDLFRPWPAPLAYLTAKVVH